MNYLDELLDEYRHPERKHPLQNATHTGVAANASCGDTITLHLIIKDGVIRDASFTGEGCVISQVTAERLANQLVGKKVEETRQLSREDVLSLLETEINPAREQCALVVLRALRAAVKVKE